MVWDWGFNWQGVSTFRPIPAVYSVMIALQILCIHMKRISNIMTPKIEIHGGSIGFNISGRGGDTGQGTGSVSIIGEYQKSRSYARPWKYSISTSVLINQFSHTSRLLYKRRSHCHLDK